MTKSITKIAIGLAMALTFVAGAASADTAWQRAHPRREEVNARAAHLDRRITAERRDGEISRREAHRLRIEDRNVRLRERADARHDRSHITRREEHRLNRQENRISRRLG